MSEYLTSAESLEKLCETTPPSPTRNGLRVVVAGGVIGGVGYGIGKVIGLADPDLFFLPYFVKAVGVVVGTYMVTDGLAGLVDPLLVHERDGLVRHRRGFTDTTSIFDRTFGRKVRPVEDASELIGRGKYILVNGLVVEKADKRERRTRWYERWLLNSNYSPGDRTNHTVKLHCLLNGRPITIFESTKDGDYAEQLRKTEGTAIYVFGTVSKHNIINPNKFGQAFER